MPTKQELYDRLGDIVEKLEHIEKRLTPPKYIEPIDTSMIPEEWHERWFSRKTWQGDRNRQRE